VSPPLQLTLFPVKLTVPAVPLNSSDTYTDTPQASSAPILYYRVRAFNGFNGGTLSAPGIVASVVVGASTADTIIGTSGNDTITLKQDSGHQFIVWTMGSQTGQIPISDAAGLMIVGNGGTDTITLDPTNGSPIPDRLRLNGTFVFGGSALSIGGTQEVDVGQSTLTIPHSVLSLVALQTYLKNGSIMSSSAVAAGGRFLPADVNSSSQAQIRYALVGDTDLDGTVAFADLLKLAQNYGASSADWGKGDFNYDGTVGFADLLALAQHYGQTTASGAAVAASLDPLFLKARQRR